MAICPGVGVCICIAAAPAGVTPLVPIMGVVPPIWLAGVSSHLDLRLLPGVGVAPGVSAPVRSVLGVSAQPGVAWPGVEWPGVSPVLKKSISLSLKKEKLSIFSSCAGENKPLSVFGVSSQRFLLVDEIPEYRKRKYIIHMVLIFCK